MSAPATSAAPGRVDAADAPAVVDEIVAPPGWRAIDFISDLHLAETTPRAFEAWARYLRTTRADAVFILGDLFDAWAGDDARFEGFEARCAAELRSASAARPVAFLAGNRDFLVGRALLDDCGVRGLADPTLVAAFGERVLLTHGDAWCVDDVDYQRVRVQVRSPAWQAAVLAQPLSQRKALARQYRQQSEAHASGRAPGDWGDVDAAVATRWLDCNAARVLVHGHTHRPGTETMPGGATRHVLADWSLDDASEGPPRAEILRWTADGFARLSPTAAA